MHSSHIPELWSYLAGGASVSQWPWKLCCQGQLAPGRVCQRKLVMVGEPDKLKRGSPRPGQGPTAVPWQASTGRGPRPWHRGQGQRSPVLNGRCADCSNSRSDTWIKTTRTNLPQLTWSLSAFISAHVQPDTILFNFIFYFMHQLISCSAVGSAQSVRRALKWASGFQFTLGHQRTFHCWTFYYHWTFLCFGHSCSHLTVMCREYVFVVALL